MKLTTLFIAGLLLSAGTVFGQKGVEDGSKYGHGEDSIACLKNLSLYYESYKNKNFKEAYPSWNQAFNECPLSSASLYSHGPVIVKAIIDKETDAAKKEDLYQQLMKVYDQRIKYFGNSKKYPTDYIYGIKAIDILRYKRDELPSMKEANELFIKSIAGMGNQTQKAVLTTHMTNTVALFKANEITAENVVNEYTKIADILEYQSGNTTNEDEDKGLSIDEIKAGIESMFANSGAADCGVIEQIFMPKFNDNSTNLPWLKRISALLDKRGCENDLVYKVSDSLHKLEPSSSSARGLAVMCLKNKEFDKAVDYYKQAIELENDLVDKGTYYYQLGLVYMSQDNFAIARTQFLKAIELRKDWGEPYLKIGVLYGAAAGSCGADEFEHRLAYWAAVDKFNKAKAIDPSVTEEANKQISTFSAHFPSKEELFFHNMQEGSTYTVGCWINESTTVRAKK